MLYETVDLYEYFHLPREGRSGGYVTAYVPDKSSETKEKIRPAMLVIPGGGYDMLSEREGDPVAIRFLSYGFASFALRYSVKTAYPVPLVEAGMAMAYIRMNAEAFGVGRDRVAAIGFSAGGHLAGMLATLFEDEHLKRALGDRAGFVRPDAAVLSYPVVTTAQKTHGGSAENISGGNRELRAALSLETRVTKNASPAFIWHTFEDDCVPVENAMLLAKAYREQGVPFELHIFEKGWHGLSVLNREVYDFELDASVARNAAWIELAAGWLKARGLTVTERT